MVFFFPTVKIQAPSSKPFFGFLLQARQVGLESPVGYFTLTTMAAQILTCSQKPVSLSHKADFDVDNSKSLQQATQSIIPYQTIVYIILQHVLYVLSTWKFWLFFWLPNFSLPQLLDMSVCHVNLSMVHWSDKEWVSGGLSHFGIKYKIFEA